MFTRLAERVACLLGHPVPFAVSIILILLWLISGPLFGWSDTWQLIVNTVTTVITFLAVFLIQNTQNRNDRAMQRKLDELIMKLQGPDDTIAGIEKRIK